VATRPRLLADDLPLRRGSDLPSYRTANPLPWCYGRVTLTPLALDAEGLRYLVADHPIQAITAVRADGEGITGWDLARERDDTGTTISVLRLTQAPSGTLAVDVVGRVSEVTGAVIEHPADVAADLLERCGLPAGDWAALRGAWPGLAVGAALDTAEPLREVLSGLIASVGARWSAQPMRAWLPDTGDIIGTLGAPDCDAISASSEATDLATRLTLSWGWNWATGEPAGAVVVACPEAEDRWGQIAVEDAAPWLRTARDAEVVARAELARLARPEWEIEARLAPGERWRPSDRLQLEHPWVPAGPAEISRLTISRTGRTVTCRRRAGPTPPITLLRHTSYLAGATAGLEVTYRDGVATYTILDDAGNPLADAAVTLDGAQTGYTDRLGQVQFRTGRGAHTLTVVAAGYATQELEVEV
jgi:hypothetical protein